MAKTFGIEMTATYVGERIDPDDRWEHHLWDVFLTREDGTGGIRSMSVPFRRGMGLVGEPTLAEVLNTIQSSARIDEYDDYDEILAEVPFSRARAMFDAIKDEADRTRTLMEDVWEDFLEQEYDG